VLNVYEWLIHIQYIVATHVRKLLKQIDDVFSFLNICWADRKNTDEFRIGEQSPMVRVDSGDLSRLSLTPPPVFDDDGEDCEIANDRVTGSQSSRNKRSRREASKNSSPVTPARRGKSLRHLGCFKSFNCFSFFRSGKRGETTV